MGVARPWPKSLPEQMLAVRQLLQGGQRPWTAQEVAGSFGGKVNKQRRAAVAELLATLAALGQAVAVDGGYVGV